MKKYLTPFFLICLCLSPLTVLSQTIIRNSGNNNSDLTNGSPQKQNSGEIKENLHNINSQQSLVFQNQIRETSLNLTSTQLNTIPEPCCFATTLNNYVSAMMPLPYSTISNGPLPMPTAFKSEVQGLTFIAASPTSALQPLVIDYGSMLSQSIIDSVGSIQPPAQPSAQ